MRERGSIEREQRPSGDRYRIVLYFGKNRVRINGRPRPSGGTSVFKTRTDAEAALMELRAEAVSRDWPLERVVGLWRPSTVSVGDRVENRAADYLNHFRGLVESTGRSGGTLREIERYATDEGHWSFWRGRSVHGITYGDVEDWHAWLARRPRILRGKDTGKIIAPKTQKNISDAFRAMLRRLHKRGEIETVPEFPSIEVPDYAPKTIELEDIERVLNEIPKEKRGAFYVAVYESLRLSEIKPIDLADWDGTKLYVGKAQQGSNLSAPVRHTKNRSAMYREPWHPELVAWLEWRVGEGRRLAPFAQALFWNPAAANRDKRWTSNPLEDTWNTACKAVGISIPFQQGTRHSFLTAMAPHLTERMLRAQSRHRDARSLDHYAKPSPKATGAAMVKALRGEDG